MSDCYMLYLLLLLDMTLRSHHPLCVGMLHLEMRCSYVDDNTYIHI